MVICSNIYLCRPLHNFPCSSSLIQHVSTNQKHYISCTQWDSLIFLCWLKTERHLFRHIISTRNKHVLLQAPLWSWSSLELPFNHKNLILNLSVTEPATLQLKFNWTGFEASKYQHTVSFQTWSTPPHIEHFSATFCSHLNLGTTDQNPNSFWTHIRSSTSKASPRPEITECHQLPFFTHFWNHTAYLFHNQTDQRTI